MKSRTGFRSDFMGIAELQRPGEFCAWYSSRSQTPDWELRGFRAIAILSLFSKCYTTISVDLLHEEKEPIEPRDVSTVSTCKDY